MRRPSDSRVGRCVLALCLGLGLGLSASAQTRLDRSQLRPIPEVSLAAAEAAVRDQLSEQRQELEAILARPDLNAAQLGAVYGETGQLYLLYDLAEPAEPCLRNAADLDPRNARWWYLLGALYQLDNRLEQAATSLERVVELVPRDGSSLMRLAEIYLRQGFDQKARANWESGQSLAGFEAAARFGLGRLAAKEARPDEAKAHFLRVLELQPNADVAHYHLGLAYRDLDDEAAMRRHFEQRGDNEVRFPDPLAMELQGKATGVGALLSLGRMSLAVGELEVAEERFRKAVELDPESSSALRSLGSSLQRQGRVDEAIDLYENAIVLEPDNAGLRYFLARLLTEHSQRPGASESEEEEKLALLRRASDHLRRSLEQSPGLAAAWADLGKVEELLGDYDGAADSVRRALEIDPSATRLRTYRARLLRGSGDLDAAKTELQLAESRATSDQDRFDVAAGWQQSGENERAISLFRALIKPTASVAVKAAAWFRIGNMQAEEGETTNAIKSYQQVVELVPEHADAYGNLATLLGREKRYRESAAAAEKAIEIDPDNHQIRFAGAMALVLADDFSQARSVLETALEKYPNQPGYAHLLVRLMVAAPDDSVRDGIVGLELAMRLYRTLPTPEHAESVAMAFAEVGRFDRAVEWQELLIRTLEKSDEPRLARALENARRLLVEYQNERPVRSPWLH